MPIDSTPHIDAVMHNLSEPMLPARRPARTTHVPETPATKIEDEDADPVIDSGPGIADPMTDAHEVPVSDPVPPVKDPEPRPGLPPPQVPPAEDGRNPPPPIKLPGQPGAPERVA